jgi:hypothetical protein
MQMSKLFVIVIGILALSGCRLAREHEPWAAQEEDMFIGFFVTADEMGGSWFAMGEHADPQGRIYAEREISPEGIGPFTFPVEGIPFFMARSEFEWGTSITSAVGPGIVTSRQHSHFTDTEERFYLEGTLNVNPRLAHMVYTFHPVFQTPDLRVYIAQGGSAISVARDSYFDEGQIQAFRIVHEATQTLNGVTTTRTVTAELGIAVMFSPRQIVMLEMDADGQLLARHEYAPDAVPPSFTPLRETAYIIIETHRAPDAKNPVTRVLHNANDGAAAVFYETDNGVIARRFVQIEW